MLLTATGQSHAFNARAFDQNNQPIGASFTWVSSNPSAVSVSANGEARALVSVGSAQVTASASGVTSSGANVVIAEPAPGAVLVSDAQVASGPESLEPAGSDALRYRLTLADVTGLAPGTPLLASETKPVAGRVVSSQPVQGSVEVALEQTPLVDLFKRIKLYISGRIEEPVEAASANPAGIRPQAGDAVPFKLGPLNCIFVTAASALTGELKTKFEPSFGYRYNLTKSDDGTVTLDLGMTGTLTTTVSTKIGLGPNFNAILSCDGEIASAPLVAGVGAVVGPIITFGLEGELNATIKGPAFEYADEVKTTTTLEMGVAYTTGSDPRFTLKQERSLEYKPKLGWPVVSSSLTEVVRLEGNVGLYGYVGLEIGSYLAKKAGVKKATASILKARFGPRAELKLGSLKNQTDDPGYASKYALKLYGQLGPSSSVQEALREGAEGQDLRAGPHRRLWNRHTGGQRHHLLRHAHRHDNPARGRVPELHPSRVGHD